MIDLVQGFNNLSAGTSGGEQQGLATASSIEDPEQPASISQSSDLLDAPITFQDAHRALEIVLEYLEQEKGSYKSPDSNYFNDGEVKVITMRSLVKKVELQTAMINKKSQSNPQNDTSHLARSEPTASAGKERME